MPGQLVPKVPAENAADELDQPGQGVWREQRDQQVRRDQQGPQEPPDQPAQQEPME